MEEVHDLFTHNNPSADGSPPEPDGGARAGQNSGAKVSESRFRISGRMKKEITGLIAGLSDQRERIEIKGMLIDFIRSIE